MFTGGRGPHQSGRHAEPVRLHQPQHSGQRHPGCDFVTATKLICSSDDATESIFANPFPLLQVTLSAPLGGGSVTGTRSDLGSIPPSSICSGTFEPEGVDCDPASGVLRVEITQPGACEVDTTVSEYKAA